MERIDYLTPDFKLEDDIYGSAFEDRMIKRLHINKKSIQYTRAGGIDSFSQYRIVEGVRNDTGNS